MPCDLHVWAKCQHSNMNDRTALLSGKIPINKNYSINKKIKRNRTKRSFYSILLQTHPNKYHNMHKYIFQLALLCSEIFLLWIFCLNSYNGRTIVENVFSFRYQKVQSMCYFAQYVKPTNKLLHLDIYCSKSLLTNFIL